MAKSKTKTTTKAESKQTTGTVRVTKAEQVLQEIDELVQHEELSRLRLAQLLYEAKYNDYWQEREHKNWKEYALSLKIGDRKADYSVNVWAMLKEHSDVFDENVVKEIGWTKAQEIATLLKTSTEDPAEWLEKARQAETTTEFQEQVKVYKRSVGRGGPVTTTFKFTVDESNARTFYDTLKIAKDMLNTKDDTEAMAHVCLTFIERFGDPDTLEELRLKDVMAWVENTFEVKLTAEDASEDASEDAQKKKTEPKAQPKKADKKADKKKSKKEELPPVEEEDGVEVEQEEDSDIPETGEDEEEAMDLNALLNS